MATHIFPFVNNCKIWRVVETHVLPEPYYQSSSLRWGDTIMDRSWMKSLLVISAFCLWLAGTSAVTSRSASAVSEAQQTSSPTPKPILYGSLPVVSPNGRRIAFVSDRSGTDDLYVISVDSRNERQLTRTPEAEGNVAWTADGKILFASFKDGFSHVYLLDANGENLRELAKVPGRAVTLSPDGKRLLYMAGTWTASRLTISKPDGSNPKEIADGSSIAWNIRWSPDGKQIAFTGRNDPKSEVAVYVMNADGSGTRQVTHVSAEAGSTQAGRWSPDGRRLAFQVNSRTQKGSAHIWTVELATGVARKLAAHSEAYLDETPSWFPNGKRIAFQSNRSGRMEVWVMNDDGTGARQITGTQPAVRP
jgi:TolB protein